MIRGNRLGGLWWVVGLNWLENWMILIRLEARGGGRGGGGE